MKPRQTRADPPQVMEPWMHQTRLVKALAHTHEDICRHKWFESERAGHDIGWDRAVVDWTLRYGHGLDETEGN